MICSSFSLFNKDSLYKMVDFTTGQISIIAQSPATSTQISHVIDGMAGTQAQIQFVGGTAVGNDGSVNYKATAGHNFRGNVTPETANTWTCGKSATPWSGGFTQTAFTVTSDERSKTAPLDITDVMLDAASEVDWVQYQYLDRVEAKGQDGARWHFGAVAQRFVEAFARHGLDAHNFGFLCYDEWEAAPEVIEVVPAILDEDGNVLEPERTEIVQIAMDAGSRYGIRYEEALALEAALQRRNFQRLLSRIEALEAR